MGEDKSVTRRAGGGAPLTRRQQKRARRRQTAAPRSQAAPRPTTPVPPPLPKPQPSSAPATRAAVKKAPARRDAAATQPALSAAPPKAKTKALPSPAQPKKTTITPSAPTAERKPRRDEAAATERRVSRTKERKASAPAALPAADGAVEHERKYPTLARMVGLRIRRGNTEPPAAGWRAGLRRPLAEPPAESPRADDAVPAFDSPPLRSAGMPDASHASDVADAPTSFVSPRRAAVPTRRLASLTREASPGAADHEREQSGARAGEQSASKPQEQPRTPPAAPLIVACAAVQAGVAVLASLAGITLLLNNAPGAVWLLSLAGMCGAGGWLAYSLAQDDQRARAAGAILLLSQVGVLAWLLALLGPRAAVLSLLPAMTLLAMRTTWRGIGVAGVAVSLTLYVADSVLALNGPLQPGLPADAGLLALLDICLLTLGLGLLLVLLLDAQARHARADALLRARLYEARQTRSRARQLRQQVEDDANALEHALVRSLRGRGGDPLRVGSALGPLAQQIELVAERLAALHQDREDRIRLEGAIRGLTRAMERSWLGLPWVWPEPSGTALDELVALLRAQRPSADDADPWAEESPTLVPLPTLDVPAVDVPAWDVITPHLTPPVAGSGGSWPIPTRDASAESNRMHAFAALQHGALPWDEWDEWRNWTRDGER